MQETEEEGMYMSPRGRNISLRTLKVRCSEVCMFQMCATQDRLHRCWAAALQIQRSDVSFESGEQ